MACGCWERADFSFDAGHGLEESFLIRYMGRAGAFRRLAGKGCIGQCCPLLWLGKYDWVIISVALHGIITRRGTITIRKIPLNI